MTDLELDIWNEWLRERQKKFEKNLLSLCPYENTAQYYRTVGHIDGMIDALSMLAIVEEGKRFQKKLSGFKEQLLQYGDYDSNGNYKKQNK